MVTRRQRRVNALIRQALGEVLHKEVADPRLDLVTVTDVETSSDLRQAHIYVTFLGDHKQQEERLGVLRKATGYLRRQLGQTVYLRYVPELSFHLDQSVEKGLRIERILQEMENPEKQDEE